MALKKVDALLRLARRGPIRARDLDELAIPRAYLTRLVNAGRLERAARGTYLLLRPGDGDRDGDGDNEHAGYVPLSVAAARVPRGVICLESALALHGLTSRPQRDVWMMINTRARTPRLEAPRLRIVRASGAALTHGVEPHDMFIPYERLGMTLMVTTPGKTVADCFRYRRRIGEALAHEALAAFVRKVRCNRRRPRARRDENYTIDALEEAARAGRVLSVVRRAVGELTRTSRRVHRTESVPTRSIYK